jgi:glycosyltransferase involved in cell wall biosynthesis
MTLLGLSGLLASEFSVLFVYAKCNTKLSAALLKLQESHPLLELYEHTTPSRKLQGIRNRFESAQIRTLAEVFRRYKPAAVLCAQGDLELSSRGLLAGKQAKLRTASYIPFAHSQADMGAKLGRFRDPFNTYLLNVPDAFITISQQAAAHFQRRGTKVPVHVVYNGIDVDRFGGDRTEARRAFDLPENGKVIALCGRLERSQKGQSVLLEALALSPFLRSEVLTLLVGDGPDEDFLKAEVGHLGLQTAVRFTGWCDPAPLYPALDALVIASRYEGMPLVMLEALVSDVPVLATDRDGMRELLPDEWRYQSGDARALAERLEALLRGPAPDKLAGLAQRVRDEMSIGAFQENFTRAVLDQCGGAS